MNQWTIGRAPDCAVIVEEGGVSRYHARITATGRGFLIEDSGSSGGTFLNGAPVHGPTSVRIGDTIGLGKKYVLRTDSGRLAHILGSHDQAPGPAPAPRPQREPATSLGPALLIGLVVVLGIGIGVFMASKSSGDTDKKTDGTVSGTLSSDDIKLGTQSLVVGNEAFCTAATYHEKDNRLTLATNRHCIEGFLKQTGPQAVMEVEFVTGKKVAVDSFSLEDTGKDLAQLHIQAGTLEAGKDYVLVPRLGTRDALKEQQSVVAIGSAMGLKWTFTKGIISRLGCPNPDQLRGAMADAFPPGFKCIQIDAAVNPGNSGGPLFRETNGEFVWIGINTLASKQGTQNINFSIHVAEFFSRDFESFPMTPEGLQRARNF